MFQIQDDDSQIEQLRFELGGFHHVEPSTASSAAEGPENSEEVLGVICVLSFYD